MEVLSTINTTRALQSTYPVRTVLQCIGSSCGPQMIIRLGNTRLAGNTNWDELFSDDINSSWLNWQGKFLEIMEECIPRRVLPPRRRNLPWLSKGITRSMRRRNTLFKRAKRSGTHQDYARFRQARNKVVGELRTAKSAYFHKLNPSNPRQFWKAVKHLNKRSSSIPVLTHNDVMHDSDEAKAELIFLKLFQQLGPSIASTGL